MTKALIKARMPSRFGKGSMAYCHFDKLRTFIGELRQIDSADYILLEQASKCYELLRGLEEDIATTGNYIKNNDGSIKGKNPLIADYKSISASYTALLRDLGMTIKDREKVNNSDEQDINDLLD